MGESNGTEGENSGVETEHVRADRDPPPTVETAAAPPLTFDVNAMFGLAANGDHDAQSALALNALQHGLDGVVPMTDAFACAELFARLAATSGQPDHLLTLSGILLQRYEHLGNHGLDELALPPLTEHYLYLKVAAEAGSEPAFP